MSSSLAASLNARGPRVPSRSFLGRNAPLETPPQTGTPPRQNTVAARPATAFFSASFYAKAVILFTGSSRALRPLSNLIFLSRWLQASLYFGLIVAQVVYVYRFLVELWHLIGFAMLGHPAPASVITTVKDTETIVMLTVLGLIDVVMIANLLIMVIVGGYETFVSRLNLAGHPDQPEWLSHVNAGILKVKLAMALIGISSIHLLKTFINANEMKESTLLWQVFIHVTFVLSALVLAWIDRLTAGGHASPALKH